MMPREAAKSSGYDASKTQAARAAAISEVVALQNSLLQKNPTKTDLSDVEAVRDVAESVMQHCAEAGVLPNVEVLAASLGISRRYFYDYLQHHKDSATAKYLETLRTGWAGLREMAMDRGAADATASIFILLNSAMGYSNQHTVEVVQPQTPLEQTDTAAARARILASLPDDLDGD